MVHFEEKTDWGYGYNEAGGNKLSFATVVTKKVKGQTIYQNETKTFVCKDYLGEGMGKKLGLLPNKFLNENIYGYKTSRVACDPYRGIYELVICKKDRSPFDLQQYVSLKVFIAKYERMCPWYRHNDIEVEVTNDPKYLVLFVPEEHFLFPLRTSYLTLMTRVGLAYTDDTVELEDFFKNYKDNKFSDNDQVYLKSPKFVERWKKVFVERKEFLLPYSSYDALHTLHDNHGCQNCKMVDQYVSYENEMAEINKKIELP